MTTIGTDSRIEDVLTLVLDAIENRDSERALSLIRGLSGDSEQIILLSRLNFASSQMMDPAGYFTLDRALARALDLAFERTLDLALTRAREIARARARAREIDFARDITRDLSRALDVALDLAFDLARALDDRDADDLRIGVAYQIIVKCLSELREVLNAESSPEPVTVENRVTFTFDGIDRLTPATLRTTLLPYLDAVADLQRIIDALEGHPHVEPRIISITQNLPVGADLEGAEKTFDAILAIIIPWRRKYAKALVIVDIEKRRKEIEFIDAEIRAKEVPSQQIEAEAVKAREDAASTSIKNEEERYDLLMSRKKDELELEFYTRYGTDSLETERLMHRPQLRQVFTTLTESPLNLLDNPTA